MTADRVEDSTADELRAAVRAQAFPSGWLDRNADNRIARQQEAMALALVDEIERLRALLATVSPWTE